MLLLSFPETFSLLAALPSKLCRQTEGSNEWVDVLQLNSLRPATDWHAHTHKHTHTSYHSYGVQHFVPCTSPSPRLPDSFIFVSSLHRTGCLGGSCGGHWRGVVPPSLGQLPVWGISRHNAGQRKRRKASLGLLSFVHDVSAFLCPLMCIPRFFLQSVCVCRPPFLPSSDWPQICVCVCVCVCLHEFAMSFSVFACCVCELCVCVCVQSLRLQALMRQRAFLSLWPLSKHIKNYLITAYTARATHTTHKC